MSSYKETAEDLVKKYHGAYVYYDNQVVWVEKIVQETVEQVSASLYGANKLHIRLPIIGGIVPWTDLMPNQQFFNLSTSTRNYFRVTVDRKTPTAMMYYRRARRQWIRSLSDSNSCIMSPMQNLWGHIGERSGTAGLCVEIVTDLITSKYCKLEEACAKLPDEGAVAISPQFALCAHPFLIGTYLLTGLYGFLGDVKDHTINLYHHVAYQELYDFIRKQREPFEIVKCPDLPSYLSS